MQHNSPVNGSFPNAPGGASNLPPRPPLATPVRPAVPMTGRPPMPGAPIAPGPVSSGNPASMAQASPFARPPPQPVASGTPQGPNMTAHGARPPLATPTRPPGGPGPFAPAGAVPVAAVMVPGARPPTSGPFLGPNGASVVSRPPLQSTGLAAPSSIGAGPLPPRPLQMPSAGPAPSPSAGMTRPPSAPVAMRPPLSGPTPPLSMAMQQNIPAMAIRPGAPAPHPHAPAAGQMAPRPPMAHAPQMPQPYPANAPRPPLPAMPFSPANPGLRPAMPPTPGRGPPMRPPLASPAAGVPQMSSSGPGIGSTQMPAASPMTQAPRPLTGPPMHSASGPAMQGPMVAPSARPSRPVMMAHPALTAPMSSGVLPAHGFVPGASAPMMNRPPFPSAGGPAPLVSGAMRPQMMPPGSYNPAHPHQAAQYPTQPPPPKVNPAAIPSVVAVLEADETRFREMGQSFCTFSSVTEHPPPLPTTRSVSIIDDGNSAPQFIRSTLNHVPVSEELCDSSKIPLALLVQPFAGGPQGSVPLVDFGEQGPIRCQRCRGYINPHVQFIKGGRLFVCNLCGMANDVPDEYYANLDMAGRRIDLDLRPELRLGTVDFVASKEYMNKPSGRPYLLFALDASRAAVSSGAFHAALETIRTFAANEAALQLYCRVGILVYDRVLHFYVLRPTRCEPQLVVMSDINDPFVPVHPDDLYFDPQQCASQLAVLLTHLSASFHETRVVDSCFGAAVAVAVESLRSRGGRALFFQTTLPSLGPGALKNRDTGTATAPADKANPLLFPQGDYYGKLAIQAAERGVSFSLVSTPAAHVDLATIGQLPRATSGTTFHYPRFTGATHTTRLVGDVTGLLQQPFAFDCVVRVRSGSGLQAKKYFGNFTTLNAGTDVLFGSLHGDQAFAVWMEYDGKLSERERISFQCATLHTDAATGQRRIRVLNLALPTTTSIQTVFRMSELDSILSLYIKKNASQILEAPASAFPASFTAKCVNILAAYRRHCASTMSSGQLILPDSLKLFPVLTLAIHKDAAFNTSPMSIDSRIHAVRLLGDLPLTLASTHFYPELYPLKDILSHEEILPACLRLSREHVQRDGVYLLNNGHQLVLYIGDSVDGAILRDIFSVPQLNAVSLPAGALPVLNNPFSAKLRQIVTVLRSQHPRHLALRVIRQSVDIAEDAEFSAMLVEDASSVAASYVDFLCRVHAQIQHALTQGTGLSLAERTSILSFLQ